MKAEIGLNEKQELKILEEMDRESKWLNSVYNEIKKKFTNKYIAIKDEEIILASKDFDELIAKLGEKGEDPRFINVQFIPSKDIMLIL